MPTLDVSLQTGAIRITVRLLDDNALLRIYPLEGVCLGRIGKNVQLLECYKLKKTTGFMYSSDETLRIHGKCGLRIMSQVQTYKGAG